MIEIRGPSNSLITFEGGDFKKSRMSPLFFCEARTLQEALDKYCQEFGATLRPYVAKEPLPPYEDGRRLVMVYDDPKTQFRDVSLVFSIERDGKSLGDIPSLAFPLQSGDSIYFGTAGC